MPGHSRTVDADPTTRSRERQETRRGAPWEVVSLLLILVAFCDPCAKAQASLASPTAGAAQAAAPTTGSGVSLGALASGSGINQGTVSSSAEDSINLGAVRTLGAPIALTAPQIFAILERGPEVVVELKSLVSDQLQQQGSQIQKDGEATLASVVEEAGGDVVRPGRKSYREGSPCHYTMFAKAPQTSDSCEFSSRKRAASTRRPLRDSQRDMSR
jgi:hypothetical protein